MSAPDANRDAKIRAQRTLEAIERLRKNEDYQTYFAAKQAKLLEKALAEMVGAKTKEELWDARTVYLERLKVVAMLDEDEKTAIAIRGPVNTSDL